MVIPETSWVLQPPHHHCMQCGRLLTFVDQVHECPSVGARPSTVLGKDMPETHADVQVGKGNHVVG